MSPDIAASIKARLLARAKAESAEFQLYLVRYACERFLYRLGASPYRERCVLKGAGLLALWMDEPYRGTRDLDFLASGPSDAGSVRELVESVAAVPCLGDGVLFDLESIDVTPIGAEEMYAGQRARITACLGKAKIRFQLDFGFGGTVSPVPESHDYPTLLVGVAAPCIRAYRREVSIAEKFEAMVSLGRRNSRMKDFHDAGAFSSAFDFDGPLLYSAVANCFERRGTALTVEDPDVLQSGFYERSALSEAWASYLSDRSFSVDPPSDFTLIGKRVVQFLGPVKRSVVERARFDLKWPACGPWSRAGRRP